MVLIASNVSQSFVTSNIIDIINDMGTVYDITDIIVESLQSQTHASREKSTSQLSKHARRMLHEGKLQVNENVEDSMLEMIREMKRIEDDRWSGVNETFNTTRWNTLIEGIDVMSETAMRDNDPPGQPAGPYSRLEAESADETDESPEGQNVIASDPEGFLTF